MTVRKSSRAVARRSQSPEVTALRNLSMKLDRWLPTLSMIAALLGWEALVFIAKIPHYSLPAPSLILLTLWNNLGSLLQAWWFTLKLTLGALLLATVGGVILAVCFALSRRVELLMLPFAVILQVTPLVAIAPLILIYIDSTTAALLLCAWIVAFFPILSSTLVGLRSANRQLSELFTLYGASPWQRLRWLLVPSALPYFMSGLKICGGLSLIAGVTAEMVAGAAGRETGLASRILEASFRTETPKLFAALLLLVLTGLLIYACMEMASRAVLRRWQ